MHFEYWGEGLLFIFIFLGLMSLPCIGVAWIGFRMLNKLGLYPSKTPAIQMSILVWLLVIEFGSFIALMGFYKIFATE